MKRNSELSRCFSGLHLFHHNFPQRKEPSHQHPEHQFFIPLGGRFSIDLENSGKNQTIQICPGDLLLIPAHMPHSFISMDQNLGEQLLGLVSVELWQNTTSHTAELCVTRVPQLLKELIWFLLVRTATKNDVVFATALVQIIVESVSVTVPPSQADLLQAIKSVSDSRLIGVLHFLQEQFTSEIDLKNIAERFSLSERTLQRLFQCELLCTPKQFLLSLRVFEAERLLKETQISITDIAYESGFGSFSSFIKAFRSATGKSPSDYRVAFSLR